MHVKFLIVVAFVALFCFNEINAKKKKATKKESHPKNTEKDKIKESETLKPPEELEEGTNDKSNKKQLKKQKKNKNKEKKIDSSKVKNSIEIMKDMKEEDNNKEIGLMEKINTKSEKPPAPKTSNLTQEDLDLLGKLDVSKAAVGKQRERAGSMSLPRSLSPIQQQPKRAFSMDHKKDDETPDESEGSTEDDSNDSAIKEEAIEEQNKEEAVQEQNTVVEQKQSKNTCPRVSAPKIYCSLPSTGVRPEMTQEATKECSDIIVDSGHLNEKDGKIYVENYKVEISGLKNIYSSVKFSNEKSEKLQGLINAQIKNAGLTNKIRGKKQSKGVQTRIDLIEAITKKQKYAQQYDGFILDLTGGFQNFSATFAEFLQDFLLALHSEKASGKTPKKQRRIFAIQLDSASKNFLSTKESEKFLASLKYVDIVFVLNDISLADWLKSKNVDCQKIILRSVDDGKGSCNRQTDIVNINLRRKRGAQESRRVKSAQAILEPIREKKPPKSHATWFVSGEEEEEEYGYNVETTAHFDNYPPKKNHRYPMRGSKGPHFKASFKGQYPYKHQHPPQFYHKQKIGYGAPPKWKHSVHFRYDPNEHDQYEYESNEYGSNGYRPNGHGRNGQGPNGQDPNEMDSEEYEHYGHGYNGRSRPMEGRNKNNYQQTPRITTKISMNIKNHRKETNKNEAKRSRGTVRFNLENEINLGEEKENQKEINEKSEKEKTEDTKAKEASEQKEVKKEKEEVKPVEVKTENKDSDKISEAEKEAEEGIKPVEKIEKENDASRQATSNNKNKIIINVPKMEEKFEKSFEFDPDEGIDLEINYALETFGGVAFPLMKWKFEGFGCKITTNTLIKLATKAISNLN